MPVPLSRVGWMWTQVPPTSTGIHSSACHDHREALTGRCYHPFALRAPLPNPGACWSSSVTAGWLERCTPSSFEEAEAARTCTLSRTGWLAGWLEKSPRRPCFHHAY